MFARIINQCITCQKRLWGNIILFWNSICIKVLFQPKRLWVIYYKKEEILGPLFLGPISTIPIRNLTTPLWRGGEQRIRGGAKHQRVRSPGCRRAIRRQRLRLHPPPTPPFRVDFSSMFHFVSLDYLYYIFPYIFICFYIFVYFVFILQNMSIIYIYIYIYILYIDLLLIDFDWL